MRLTTLPPAQQATEYTQLGREYLSQGLLPEAEEEFNSAIAAVALGDPASAPAHAGLAQVREQSSDAAAARTEAQASLKLAPNVNAYLVLARLDLQANELTACAADVHNALALEPTNAAAMGMRSALQGRGVPVP
jgi:tetratricopeptide (TPR) repeat protein